MSVLLGEPPGGVADAVGFINRPFGEVLDRLIVWRRELGRHPKVGRLLSMEQAVGALEPEQHPWKREALVACGGWTAYLNEGADPWPVTSYLSTVLATVGVIAVCSVNPPHASTQLELLGPTGAPSLMYVRTVAAHCEDGRWSWHESGDLQPFEEPERYQRRRIRDRFDRHALLSFLAAMGIPIDRLAELGPAVVVDDEP